MTSDGRAGSPDGLMSDAKLAEVFVSLADTLVDDYDVAELMGRLTAACVDLLGAAAAGLMLLDHRGDAQVVGSSSEQMHVLDLLQIQSDQGPCRDCLETGAVVRETDLSGTSERWPSFAPAALAAGFTGVLALPLRLRSEALGALNLLFSEGQGLADSEQRVAQALADVATIGVLQQRAVHQGTVVEEQLQRALSSRVVIEQAKGMMAQHLHQSMEQSFEVLRTYARNHNVRLTDLAYVLTLGRMSPEDVALGRDYPSEPQ